MHIHMCPEIMKNNLELEYTRVLPPHSKAPIQYSLSTKTHICRNSNSKSHFFLILFIFMTFPSLPLLFPSSQRRTAESK